MSWSRSSRLGLAALLLLALVAAVGVASAVSVTQDQAPEEAEVGQEVNVTVELQDLFAQRSSWELNGQTELENAQWTVELYEGDQRIDTRDSSGAQPNPVYLEESVTDADRIVVTVTGTVPSVGSYNYSDPATFLSGEVVQVADGGDTVNYLTQHQTRHYTTGDPGSQGARAALDDANATIEAAAANGSDVSQARSTFQDAVAAYNGGNFGEAVSLAEEAATQAESSDSGSGSGSGDGGGSSDGGGTSGADSGGNGSETGGQGGTNQTDSDGSGGAGQSDGSGSSGESQNGTTDGGNASSSGGSDDGGLLMPILYGLLGLLILGAVGGGLYWYQQKNQGPSRDPLG